MIDVLSYAATAITILALLWGISKNPSIIIRPTFLFVGFFWLQVEFSSAINSKYIYFQLNDPWLYFLLVHAFPIAILSTLPFTFKKTTNAVAARLADALRETAISALLTRLIVLLTLIYLFFSAYLIVVPFNKTGLYALIFNPGKLDEYRELSMKLIDNPFLAYSFSFLEKVLSPLAGAFATQLAIKSWQEKQYLLVLLAIVGIVFSAIPAIIYGARGPITMILLAAIVTFLALNLKRIRITSLFVAAIICVLPISLIMTLKSEEFTLESTAFQFGNIVDRAIGRGYIDNVWHLRYVEDHGLHGIDAIEKVAVLLGRKPKDSMNEVGQEFYDQAAYFGLGFLQFGTPPAQRNSTQSTAPSTQAEQPATQAKQPASKPSEIADQSQATAGSIDTSTQSPEIDIRETASSGASFVILNYTMFGLWSIPVSLAFILATDFLLIIYMRMPKTSMAPLAGAISVPMLNLCFSFMTTVMASKGLLIMPIVAWILGLTPKNRKRFNPNQS